MATLAPPRAADRSFWQKMALGMALFIVFGFAQFALRGFVDPARAPLHVHAHGVVMLGWLALTVAQTWLVDRDNLALHRRLGWLGIGLAAGLVALGSYTGIHAVMTQRQPPFFAPPYFLALSQVGLVAFAGLIAAAVATRRRTEWHRRFMLGALILILEPALGRVLPMPLIMPWGGWLSMAIRLGVVGLVARHDSRTLGRVHPATVIVALVVAGAHVAVEVLARVPAWIALAERLVGG